MVCKDIGRWSMIGVVELQCNVSLPPNKENNRYNNYNISSLTCCLCCGICRASTLPIFEIQMKMNIFNPTSTLYMWNYPLTIHMRFYLFAFILHLVFAIKMDIHPALSRVIHTNLCELEVLCRDCHQASLDQRSHFPCNSRQP